MSPAREREFVLCGLPLIRSRKTPLDRQTSTLQVLLTEVSEKWTSKILESLDALLSDSFATSYLLRFSATEFNSENISFLVATREYFSQSSPPNHELRTCLVSRSRISHALCSTRTTALSAFALALSQAAVCLPADLKSRTKEWLKSNEDTGGHDIIVEASKLVFKTIVHDTFFRFKSSDFCAELRALHLSNMLQRPHFRSFLSAQLTTEQEEAVHFWQSADEFSTQHKCLASGWAADTSVRAAKAIVRTYQSLLKDKIGLSDASLAILNKRLPEAPPELFAEAQLAVLNFLSEPYERLLDDSESCEAWLQNAGLSRASTTVTPPPSMADLEADYGLDDENYAAGW